MFILNSEYNSVKDDDDDDDDSDDDSIIRHIIKS